MFMPNSQAATTYTTQINFFVSFIYVMRAHIAYINYTKKLSIFNILNFFVWCM